MVVTVHQIVSAWFQVFPMVKMGISVHRVYDAELCLYLGVGTCGANEQCELLEILCSDGPGKSSATNVVQLWLARKACVLGTLRGVAIEHHNLEIWVVKGYTFIYTDQSAIWYDQYSFVIYINASLYSPTLRRSFLINNSSPPNAAYIRQWIWPALVQIMACRLFGAKPLSKPMPRFCQLGPWEQTSVKF